MFNIVIILNKDKIINRFNNRYIVWYIKYQVILSKITLFYFPLLLLTGLFTLCHGHYWLITHQIPYFDIDTDLHQYVSSSSSVLGLVLSTKIKSHLK